MRQEQQKWRRAGLIMPPNPCYAVGVSMTARWNPAIREKVTMHRAAWEPATVQVMGLPEATEQKQAIWVRILLFLCHVNATRVRSD